MTWKEHYEVLSLELPDAMTLAQVQETIAKGDQVAFYFGDDSQSEFQATVTAIGRSADETALMLTIETTGELPEGIKPGSYTFRIPHDGFPWDGELDAPDEMFEAGELTANPGE